MGGSQREDFLLRQAKDLAKLLSRIIGLRASGAAEQAGAELEQAYELLLGSQGELLRSVDAKTAAALVGSPVKLLAFARLLAEESAQSADPARAAALRAHAVEIAVETASLGGMDGAMRDFLRELAPALDRGRLTREARDALERAEDETP